MSKRSKHWGDCSIYALGSVVCDCGFLRQEASKANPSKEIMTAWSKHQRAAEPDLRINGEFPAAYIAFPGGKPVARTKMLGRAGNAIINADIALDGTLVGIEVLGV